MIQKQEHDARPQDEDDSISLTSTVDSEHSTDHEFLVSCILAEKIEAKKKKYLIRWDGYPEERSSWEPSETIPLGICSDWNASGNSKFDVDGFEQRQDEIADQKEHRRKLREAERQRRRNLIPDDEESDEGIRGPIRRKTRGAESGMGFTPKSEKPVQKSRVEVPKTARPSRSRSRAMSLSDSDVPLSKSLSRRKKNLSEPQAPSSSDSHTPTASRRVIPARVAAPKPPAAGTMDRNVQGKGNKPSERGMKVTRGKSSIGRNVFASTGTIRKRANLLENSNNPAKDAKHYKTIHIVRKAELAAREKADAAPKDPSVLDLFDPAHPIMFKPSRTTMAPAPSSNVVVPQTNPRNVAPEASRTPARKDTVCYFYHLNQGKDNACSKGYMCDYSHDLSRNLTVASAPGVFMPTKPNATAELAEGEPEHRVEPERRVELELRAGPDPRVGPETRVGPALICFFWANGGCTKMACKYYHEWREGFSVAATPGGTKFNTICWFYYTRGSCSRDHTCKFIHSMDTNKYEVSSVPTSVPESAQAARPRYEPYNSPSTNTNPTSVLESPQTVRPQYEPYNRPSMNTIPLTQPGRGDFEPFMSSTNTNAEEQMVFVQDDQPGDGTSSKDLGSMTKMFTLGRNDQEPIRFTLDDIDQSHPWVQLLDSLEIIGLNETCMAQDFGAVFNSLRCREIWAGRFVPVDNTIQSRKISQDLIYLSSGLMATLTTSFQSHHKLLVYPTGDNSWTGLNQNQNGAKSALNYYVFESLPWPVSTGSSKSILPEIARDPNSLPRLSETIRSLLSTPTELNTAPESSSELINVIDIISMKDSQKTSQAYFFIFPSTARELFQYMAKMLIRRDGKTYSSESEGAWLSFVDDPSPQQLIVLVHGSMVSEICNIPKLQQLLRKKSNPRVFSISDASPYGHISSSPDSSSLKRITADKLFPHGACILLTPGLMVTSPEWTLKILEWYFGKLKHGRIEVASSRLNKATRGSYKLVVCHAFPDYLLDLAKAKAIERDRFMEKNHSDPSKDYKASQMGLSYDNCHARFKVHAFVTELYSAGILGSANDSLIDYYNGIADEDASPIMFTCPSIDPDNEPALVEWFAGYAAMKLRNFRKFVVLGNPVETSRLREKPASISRDEAMDKNVTSEIWRARMIAARLSAPKDRDSGTTMQIDSVPKETWETVKFVPTLQWYHAKGSPWNHISVDNYQVQWGYLNPPQK
ncbi:hypothetical protein BJ875DRAFT_240872 [Amylocarpus encephaloides]|uniref:Chromo domain-containing protein n=1 Tax=Amylocarpus encephaloides TaxID=45428 RepID=A0A9P7YN93_9HELO|nr:hypothetical protein BJ875DRAFT_240872 [Amylocarpus encephaloides]